MNSNFYSLNIDRKEIVYFYQYEFFINSFVLRPRSDSEILVDFIAKEFYGEKLSILDLGTGSGCLICSLLMKLPYSRGTAIDISHLALEVCKYNISYLGLLNRINIIRNNWLEDYDTHHDLLISNPPYVLPHEIDRYNLYYDPQIALLGDLSFYRKIAYKQNLFKFMILEINPIFLDDLHKMFKIKSVIKDYVGLNRFIYIDNS